VTNIRTLEFKEIKLYGVGGSRTHVQTPSPVNSIAPCYISTIQLKLNAQTL